MGTLKTPASAGKRHRSSHKTGRRLSSRKESRRSQASLPAPAAYPRKARKVQNAMRGMAMVAMFFIFLSTVSSWRSRAIKKRISYETGKNSRVGGRGNFLSTFVFRPWHSKNTERKDIQVAKEDTRVDAVDEGEPLKESNEAVKHNTTNHAVVEEVEVEKDDSEHEKISEEAKTSASVPEVNGSGGETSSLSQGNSDDVRVEDNDEQSTVSEELPERIEWYSRDDYKEGSRPMCRVSKPYILSNGTIMIPDWMQEYEKLLKRCGLGKHSFYSSKTGPEGLESIKDIGADFVLTIHPERFQEPTHVASVYLTEHILKSSYLFDIFSGYAPKVDGVKEHHCYTSEKDSTCALPRPVKAVLKPAIFVPKRIESGSNSMWSRQLLEMLGKAHGNGQELIHLNASSILNKDHKGQSENLVGTGFRSIIITDGMFRHLPRNALKHSNLYSSKNGIDKSSKQKEAEEGCKITVGIGNSGEPEGGIQGADELKEKVEVVSRLAVPGSTIEARTVTFSREASLHDHIKEMQQLDIFVGGSGDEMSSMGFLQSGSVAIELMPFGIKPNTHESMAQALGLQYSSIRGKPQESFKICLEGEIFNLRKKGTLSYTELPEWEEPTVKAWDAAVSNFVLSGSSTFDILTAQAPINNYHARVCAQKQNIEVAIDEAARQIAVFAKEKCAGR